jgi:hypothetical protein
MRFPADLRDEDVAVSGGRDSEAGRRQMHAFSCYSLH